MNKYLYEIVAYTGRWAHRRKFFVDESDAMEWANSEFEDTLLEAFIYVFDDLYIY